MRSRGRVILAGLAQGLRLHLQDGVALLQILDPCRLLGDDRLGSTEFRLAVGAVKLRSLWWEKSAMASARGGQWVVEGRGFGHGVGLPQVSAWWLANDGAQAADIVARYYPDATLARIWH